jgi:hypothetical protein
MALLVDDYGHHPTELERDPRGDPAGAWPGRRLVVAFQPHRYTRTRDLMDDFARVLADTEALLLVTRCTPPARSRCPTPTAARCARAIRSRGKRRAGVRRERFEKLPEALAAVLRDGRPRGDHRRGQHRRRGGAPAGAAAAGRPVVMAAMQIHPGFEPRGEPAAPAAEGAS